MLITKKIDRMKLIRQLQVSGDKFIVLIVQSNNNKIDIKDLKQIYSLLTEN